MTDVLRNPEEIFDRSDPVQEAIDVILENALDDYDRYAQGEQDYFVYFFVLGEAHQAEAHSQFCDDIWLDHVEDSPGTYISAEGFSIRCSTVSYMDDSKILPDVIVYHAGNIPAKVQILIGELSPTAEA